MLLAVQSNMWNELELMIKMGQDIFMGLRTAPKPVVAAPHQMALGGGCEICLAADRIVADAETYMGLVEVGIGVIPGWGGCKEMVRRRISPHMNATNVNPTPYLRQVFETVGFAKVSTSGEEARELGFLTENDLVVLNTEHRIAEAKHQVLTLAEPATARRSSRATSGPPAATWWQRSTSRSTACSRAATSASTTPWWPASWATSCPAAT